MSYFEFDDARRIHMPYEDAYSRSKCKPIINSFSESLAPCSLQQHLAQLETRNVLHVHKSHGRKSLFLPN
jgi:hypothetical protein